MKALRLLHKPYLMSRDLPILVFVGSLFVFPYYVRDNVSGILGVLNIAYYFGWFLFVRKSHLKATKKSVLIYIGLLSHFLVIEILGRSSLHEIARTFIYNYLPLLVVISYYEHAERQRPENLGEDLLKMYNAFVIVLFTILVIDLLTGSKMTEFLVVRFEPTILGWLNVGLAKRHVSFIGHYLITASIYLVFFLLNMAYSKLNRGKGIISLWSIYVISTVGILSTASKMPLFLLLVSMVLTNSMGEHRVRSTIIMLFVLLVTYRIGFFDLVIERFGEADITSGRNDALLAVWKAEGPPHLLYGYGSTLQESLASPLSHHTISALQEYPYIAVSYKYGLAHTVILLSVQFLLPARLAIVQRKPEIAALPLILALDFGGFNGYLAIPDACMIASLFSLIFCLLLYDFRIDETVSHRLREVV